MLKTNLQKEFSDIAGFEIYVRRTNYLSDKIKRKDGLFGALAKLYFLDRVEFEKIRRKVSAWIKSDPCETIFSLAGYIFYIAEDFTKARKYFLLALHKNSDNLDNWIDLAFALRHSTCFKISNCILFYYHYMMYYYHVLKVPREGYQGIKKLALKVLEAIEGKQQEG